MVRDLERMEISEAPDLASLVDEVRASGRPRALTRNGEEVAVLTPRKTVRRKRSPKPRTAADVEAFLSSAGGWKDNVDVEALKAGFRESRKIPPRPMVEL